jgi:hypothetical protein
MAARVRDGPHSRGRVAIMDDQRVRNSEEMDEQEAIQFLTELVSNLSAERLYEIIHEDYTLEMPQSAYANPRSIQVRRVLVRDGLWTFEGVNDYGGDQVYNVAVIIELEDSKMFRDTRYYAEPFEGPQWRAQWVEWMEP